MIYEACRKTMKSLAENYKLADGDVWNFMPVSFDELLRRTSSSDSSFNEPGTIKLEDLRRV